jgi:low-affinity ferrous iron transport protein
MELDEQLFAAVKMPPPPRINQPTLTLSDKISIAVGRVTASAITVLFGVLLIVGLIVGASAMGWSTTGQLLCNVPPSIIESSFMIILITGHNFADAERRVQLGNLYWRRLGLIAFVEKVATITPK